MSLIETVMLFNKFKHYASNRKKLLEYGFSAYHMSKRNCFSAKLDMFSSVDDFFGYVIASRELSKKKSKKC